MRDCIDSMTLCPLDFQLFNFQVTSKLHKTLAFDSIVVAYPQPTLFTA